MDQKVLAALIDKKSYKKLTNDTLDVKKIRENEIPDLFASNKQKKDSLKT